MLMRREEMFARARTVSSIADILEDVECDQRLMFRLGLNEFSGRLLERLLS